MTLSALKCQINDMNRSDTVKAYAGLEKMLKELDKRVREYRDRGGVYDEDETASIMYTMTDRTLKNNVRRCKVASHIRAMRSHIAGEASENRASAIVKNKGSQRSNAMDVCAVAGNQKGNTSGQGLDN